MTSSTQVNLAESADDTTLLADLKNLARKALDNAYLRDDTQQLLRMAMFLDPRLKRLPFFNKEQKAAVQKLIRNELVKVGWRDARFFLWIVDMNESVVLERR